MVLELTPEKKKWLRQNGYEILTHLAHGKNSCVWKVRLKHTPYVLKTTHPKSDRWLPLSDEAAHLQDANRRGVGPKIVMYNLVPEMLFLDYIDGKDFPDWLEIATSEMLRSVLSQLFHQAEQLDDLGLKHFKLGKVGHAIRIDKNNNPHILDFDKTKYVPNPQNKKDVLRHFFLGKTSMAKRIQKILGKTETSRLLASNGGISKGPQGQSHYCQKTVCNPPCSIG